MWCEAACEPGQIGHTELFTGRRIAGALSVTALSDFRIFWPFWPLELTTLRGMAGALVWLTLRPVPEGVLARVVSASSLTAALSGHSAFDRTLRTFMFNPSRTSSAPRSSAKSLSEPGGTRIRASSGAAGSGRLSMAGVGPHEGSGRASWQVIAGASLETSPYIVRGFTDCL